MRVPSERGAAAILVALCLVLLMGMAAFAVDLSAAKNERRLDQNGADASVLAGALEFALGGSAQQIIDDAKAYASTNVRTITNPEWASCTDSQALPILSTSIPGVTNASPCISFKFDPDDQLMRVRIPDQETQTSFGLVLGVTELTTFAAAEARIFETSNGAYPSGVFDGTAAGAEVCVKTSSGGGGGGGGGGSPSSSCGGSTTGDFGNFNPWFYTELGGGSLCTSGNQPQPLARAIADGLDHRLGTTATEPGTRVNGDNCPGFPGPLNPNRVDSGGGYSPADITNGLIFGGSWPGTTPFEGRLTRANVGGFTIFGEEIDNKPLWEYIDPGAANHADCVAAANLNPNLSDPLEIQNAENLMQSCLANENDLLFFPAIAGTTRLATVPEYHEDAPLGSNACCYDIKRFVPIFIQGVWTNSTNMTCSGVATGSGFCLHEPGMNGDISAPNAGLSKIDSASAIVIRCNQLPEPLCATIDAGGTGEAVFYELELTR